MNNGKGKYIRTENGIYELCWVNNDEYYSTKKGIFHASQILKQSDTIEELCDEFVGVSKVLSTIDYFIITDRLAIKKPNEIITFSGGIYGAIWTDKGLIYVAKMNDKGEWELL